MKRKWYLGISNLSLLLLELLLMKVDCLYIHDHCCTIILTNIYIKILK